MLLLAHLSREEVPAVLQKDLDFLLSKGLPMLVEMLGMTMARMQVQWSGWLGGREGRGGARRRMAGAKSKVVVEGPAVVPLSTPVC